jgi:two-component system sensor histidine kinase QseC
MKSIRVFLVTTILAVVTLFSFITTLHGYQTSLQETGIVFDNQLIEKAQLLAHFDIQGNVIDMDKNSVVAFQIWQNETLVASSGNVSTLILGKPKTGFDYQNFNGYRWRTYVYETKLSGNRIVVSERQDIRFSLAENLALRAVLPTLLGLPLLALLIWFVVSRGLQPMNRLARELSSKRAGNLGPIKMSVNTRELTQIVNSSDGLLERLKSALQREKQFASDAAHELRTPISSLKIQLHNISHELSVHGSSDIQKNTIEITELHKIAHQLEHVVEQILALYRTSPDEYHQELQPINLTSLVQQVIAEEYDSFDAKGQSIELTGEPHFILGDSFSLSTLVQNLLSNANKYTPHDGTILVQITQKQDQILLVVEDSGPGIPEIEHDRLFQRFYRVGGDRHASGQIGCGLGLAIVKHIADLYSAKIMVSASKTFITGAMFSLLFPSFKKPLRDSQPK